MTSFARTGDCCTPRYAVSTATFSIKPSFLPTVCRSQIYHESKMIKIHPCNLVSPLLNLTFEPAGSSHRKIRTGVTSGLEISVFSLYPVVTLQGNASLPISRSQSPARSDVPLENVTSGFEIAVTYRK